MDNWIRRILADCSPRVGIILQQFREVISDMCKEDNQLQNIREAIHLQEGALKKWEPGSAASHFDGQPDKRVVENDPEGISARSLYI